MPRLNCLISVNKLKIFKNVNTLLYIFLTYPLYSITLLLILAIDISDNKWEICYIYSLGGVDDVTA